MNETKALAYQLRLAGDLVPVDYYTVFSELEAQLADEFDFINEAQAMERIGDTLAKYMSGGNGNRGGKGGSGATLVTPRPVYRPADASGCSSSGGGTGSGKKKGGGGGRRGGGSGSDSGIARGELLGTRRVLVMDYLKGVPLTRALESMRAKGIDPAGPEARLFGRKLVRTLTEAFGVSILLDG